MDWFLYNNGLRHERVKVLEKLYKDFFPLGHTDPICFELCYFELYGGRSSQVSFAEVYAETY